MANMCMVDKTNSSKGKQMIRRANFAQQLGRHIVLFLVLDASVHGIKLFQYLLYSYSLTKIGKRLLLSDYETIFANAPVVEFLTLS